MPTASLAHWTQRKESFLDAAEELIEKMRHRPGRKPKVVVELHEIVCDADMRRKMAAVRFVDLETQVRFWKEAL